MKAFKVLRRNGTKLLSFNELLDDTPYCLEYSQTDWNVAEQGKLFVFADEQRALAFANSYAAFGIVPFEVWEVEVDELIPTNYILTIGEEMSENLSSFWGQELFRQEGSSGLDRFLGGSEWDFAPKASFTCNQLKLVGKVGQSIVKSAFVF
jgi:hypothetical protein